MKKTIVSIIALLALGATGFSQSQTFVLKTTGDPVESEPQTITFKADKGAGKIDMEMDVKIQWNPNEKWFTMLFQNEKGDNGKCLYFFPKNATMKLMKKEDNKLWFDKQLIKDGKKNVYAYNNKKNDEKSAQILVFDLDNEESFELKFPTGNKALTLYAYVADNLSKGSRGRRVVYMSEVKFTIKLEKIELCAEKAKLEKAVADVKKEQDDIEQSLKTVEQETQNLQTNKKLVCCDIKKMSKKTSKKAEITDNTFGSCKEFKLAVEELSKTVEKYNAAIENYNTTLAAKQACTCKPTTPPPTQAYAPPTTKPSQPTTKPSEPPATKPAVPPTDPPIVVQPPLPPSPPPCKCDCNTLKKYIDGEDGLGKIKTRLKQNLMTKEEAKEKMKPIKDLAECKECQKCKDDYKKVQELCTDIEELINSKK